MEYRELNETHLKDMATLFVKAFNTYPWNEECDRNPSELQSEPNSLYYQSLQ